MDKNSRYELQKIDCNCNDCGYMIRDTKKYQESIEMHRKMQLSQFESAKKSLYDKASYWMRKGCEEKHDALIREAEKMVFQFSKKDVSIHYGVCKLKNKNVTFIPNVCQIDTQCCFKHRMD